MLFLQPAILRPAGRERFATRRPHLDKGALHKILHNHCVPPAAEVGGDELLKRREAGVEAAIPAAIFNPNLDRAHERNGALS